MGPTQAKAAKGETSYVSPALESQIRSLKGGGQPLDSKTCAFFEPRFEADFSQVKVHTDAKAARLALMTRSRAFTIGQDIVFGAGRHRLASNEDRRLIGHELTHTLQQHVEKLNKKPANQIEKKPSSPAEILSTWLNRWLIWKEKKDADPDWELDCGMAVRQAFLKMGGKRWQYIYNRREGNPFNCSQQDCDEANSRAGTDYQDKIINEECNIHSGRPGPNLTVEKIPLKPGMTIFTAESCIKAGKQARWASTHMLMYYGEGKIIDSINLVRPHARTFGPSYVPSQSDFFVVLQIFDPLKDMRE